MDETLNGMTDFGKLFKNHVFQSVCVGMGISSGSVVKNPPANDGDLVRSLGWEDPMKKEMATHSSLLAWEIPWTEKPGRLQSIGSQRVGHN